MAAVQVDARKADKPLLAPSGASSSKETHPFGWRDATDIIVKWRQLSEPNDQVLMLEAFHDTCFELHQHSACMPW